MLKCLLGIRLVRTLNPNFKVLSSTTVPGSSFEKYILNNKLLFWIRLSEATFSNVGLEVHKQKLTYNTFGKKFDEIGEAVEAGQH